jgi:hypothetical protein
VEELGGPFIDGVVIVVAGTTGCRNAPAIEGDRVLHVLTGLGPLVR